MHARLAGAFIAFGAFAMAQSCCAQDTGLPEAPTAQDGAPSQEDAPLPDDVPLQTDVASVTVFATQHEVAAAEIAAEEKQRVFGVIPNFYVVYSSQPTPLSRGQKFHLAWRSTIDPVSFLGSAFSAGVEQATNAFPGYGQGAAGYAKRFGASYADGAISTFLGGAILPVVFRQDPRYYFQGTGSNRSRAKHAIASVFVTHGNNGKRQFNYSNILGNFASAGLSNLYYPASDRNGAGLTIANVAIGTGFGMFAALMQEFVVPRLTPHLPSTVHRGK